MNKVIIVLLCLIFLLMIVLCYYSKIFLIIFLFIISILVFLLIIYIGNETTNKIIHNYKFLVSLIINKIKYNINNKNILYNFIKFFIFIKLYKKYKINSNFYNNTSNLYL